MVSPNKSLTLKIGNKMACETKTKTIGDIEYSVTQWPAQKAILNKMKLLKIIGPSLAVLGGGFSKKGNELDVLSQGISTLFDNSSPEDVTSFMKECVIGVGCGETVMTESLFTETFSGDSLMEFYKVFLFVLEVNYKDLMKGQWAERLKPLVKG